jgi:hypothetical protein
VRRWESREDAASGLEDQRVSRELLGALEGDEAVPPRNLVVGVLARVRRALGLRDLFDGLAVGPFRTFALALRRQGRETPSDRGGSSSGAGSEGGRNRASTP